MAVASTPRRRSNRPWVGRALVEALMLLGLGALVVAVFSLVLLGLGRGPDAGEALLLAAAAIAAAVSAVLWVPARRRLEPAVTRLVHGERGPPDAALRAFDKRLAQALPLDELLLGLAETLRRTLALEVAEVWIATDTLLERVASDPARPAAGLVLTEGERRVVVRAGVSGAAWAAVWLPALMVGRDHAELRVAPIVNAGELLGLLVVQRGPHAEPFDEGEERVVGELTRRAGLALRNLRLDSALKASLDELRSQAAELRASRARVVAAADAERRRIERDIHDGAQQQLIALAMNLRVARELAGSDQARSQALLEQLGRDIRDALEDIRSLARGIYPALLLDGGLAPALGAAAASAPIPVRVDGMAPVRYPAEVEASVYFCCAEALQNAAKHAGSGARVELRLQGEPGLVRFEVSDDGRGFSPGEEEPGSGLRSMADRVGAVGGTLSVVSAPGRGTTVAGRVPVAYERSAR